MAVKLHGVVKNGAQGASVTPIRPVAPSPTPPVAGGKKKPEAFHAPWTVGRVVYFLVMSALLTVGTMWLVGWLRFVTATGVLERDVDRLAPRERGRITRVAVKNGDLVKAGDSLVWLDYSGKDGFISDATARAESHDANLEGLRERRRELDRLAAIARTQLAGWQATARGLEPERRTLAQHQLSALRLKREGAATDAEVGQVQVQLQQVEQQLSTAREQAEAQAHVLERLRSEAAGIDKALATQAPAPVVVDEGVIKASRDGVVAWVAFHTGEVVQPTDAVILLADPSKVRVRAFVPPKDAQALQPGKPAEVRLPSGEVLKAVVDRVSLVASVAPEPTAPSLGKPQQPTLTAQALPPVDPNAAFLLGELSIVDVPPALAPRLAAGAPCEVKVKRSWAWLRDLVRFGG